MEKLVTKDINTPQEWLDILYLIKMHINEEITEIHPIQVAEALCHVTLRDALLYTIVNEQDTLRNFFAWWNKNTNHFSSLPVEQKCQLLSVLAGALLLEGRWEETEAAITLGMKYAAGASIAAPGLLFLLNRSMNAAMFLNKKVDAVNIWRKSLETVELKDIVSNKP